MYPPCICFLFPAVRNKTIKNKLGFLCYCLSSSIQTAAVYPWLSSSPSQPVSSMDPGSLINADPVHQQQKPAIIHSEHSDSSLDCGADWKSLRRAQYDLHEGDCTVSTQQCCWANAETATAGPEPEPGLEVHCCVCVIITLLDKRRSNLHYYIHKQDF